jgi:hypothetical protein
MLEWAPHRLGLQNIQYILKWVTKNNARVKKRVKKREEEEERKLDDGEEEDMSLPMLLPVEFVESLRLRVKETKRQTICNNVEMSSIVERMSAAGIVLSSTDVFNN